MNTTTQTRMDGLTIADDRRARVNSSRSRAERSATVLTPAQKRCSRLGARWAFYGATERVLGGSAFFTKGGTEMTSLAIRLAMNEVVDQFLKSSHLPNAHLVFACHMLAAVRANRWLMDQIPYDVFGLAQAAAA